MTWVTRYTLLSVKLSGMSHTHTLIHSLTHSHKYTLTAVHGPQTIKESKLILSVRSQLCGAGNAESAFKGPML